MEKSTFESKIELGARLGDDSDLFLLMIYILVYKNGEVKKGVGERRDWSSNQLVKQIVN